MGVTVQNHIGVRGRVFRGNMDEAKSHAISFQIETERPFDIAIAIAAHNRHRRAKRFNGLKERGRANVAEVPDLVGVPGQRLELCRQLIVGIGKNEDADR